MTEPFLKLLTRLSEAGGDAILTGAMASPFQGPLFDRLLARRIIVEDEPLTDWEVCERCDCGLGSRRIRALGERRFRAECPLDRHHDVDLSEDDLSVYRVSAPDLATVIGAVAGFGEVPSQLVSGLWQLGILPNSRIVFLALEPAPLPARQWPRRCVRQRRVRTSRSWHLSFRPRRQRDCAMPASISSKPFP